MEAARVSEQRWGLTLLQRNALWFLMTDLCLGMCEKNEVCC
jgi:hypothetical protein